jgi:hypothetical protein
MSMRMAQMSQPVRIAAAYRALREMPFKNVRPRKGVAAQNASIRSVAGVSQKMALEMLCVEVVLAAMRTRELAVLVFNWGNLCGRARSNAGISTIASSGWRTRRLGHSDQITVTAIPFTAAADRLLLQRS